MKNDTRAVTRNRDPAPWDGPLVWYGIFVSSFGAVVFFWPDFERIINWVGT